MFAVALAESPCGSIPKWPLSLFFLCVFGRSDCLSDFSSFGGWIGCWLVTKTSLSDFSIGWLCRLSFAIGSSLASLFLSFSYLTCISKLSRRACAQVERFCKFHGLGCNKNMTTSPRRFAKCFVRNVVSYLFEIQFNTPIHVCHLLGVGIGIQSNARSNFNLRDSLQIVIFLVRHVFQNGKIKFNDWHRPPEVCDCRHTKCTSIRALKLAKLFALNAFDYVQTCLVENKTKLNLKVNFVDFFEIYF